MSVAAYIMAGTFALFGVGLWLWGYHAGVRNTERRWGEAVSRADEARKWEDQCRRF